jgi:hypothetical protein
LLKDSFSLNASDFLLAGLAAETADFFEFCHGGYRIPRQSFRKCFIDAEDSEFHVAAR